MDYSILNLNLSLIVLNTSFAVNHLVQIPRRMEESRHSHSYMELYYITDGISVLRLDYNRRLSLGKDQWVLIGQNVSHEEIVHGQCSGYQLGIATDPAGMSLFTGLQATGHLTGRNNRQIGEILRRVWMEQTERPMGYEQSCRHLLSVLLIDLCRWSGNIGQQNSAWEENSESVRTVIDRFFGQVYRCETDDLTPERLAGQLHVSIRHLSRLLQKHYGMSFQQLLLSTRLQFTEHLLLNSDKSVSEICEMCNLSEPYLIRSFKEQYGITPAQYRRQKGIGKTE